MISSRGSQSPSLDISGQRVEHDVARAFDAIAGSFDETLENQITRRLREKIYAVIQSYVRPGSTLIDINCGTGIDALRLSEIGFRVTGIDISAGMIEAAKKKVESSGHPALDFVQGSYDRLDELSLPVADAVFSNFGGMNCTADLKRTARSIHSITKPGGYFFGVLMPPFALWEFTSFVLRLRWKEAFRRFGVSTSATGFRGKTFPVYYYSPASLLRAFSSEFVFRRLIGLSIVSPTPQSMDFASRHPRLTAGLEQLDNVIEELPFVRAAGDHYFVVLQKRR